MLPVNSCLSLHAWVMFPVQQTCSIRVTTRDYDGKKKEVKKDYKTQTIHKHRKPSGITEIEKEGHLAQKIVRKRKIQRGKSRETRK